MEFIKKILQKLQARAIAAIHDKAKNFVNSIRWPRFLSFFILKNGTINPTLEQSLAESPAAEENWDRLGLEKETSIGLKRWALFLFLIVSASIRFWSETATNAVQLFTQFMLSQNNFPAGEALPFKYAMDGVQYGINFLSQFGVFLCLAIIGKYIYTSFTKK